MPEQEMKLKSQYSPPIINKCLKEEIGDECRCSACLEDRVCETEYKNEMDR